MKFFAVLFLLFFSSGLCTGQKMTDRELAGLKGNVHVVKESEEKLSPNPRKEEASLDSEYDKAGNELKESSYMVGVRTIYFVVDGSKVSRSEEFAESKLISEGLVVDLGNTDTPSKPKTPKQEKRADDRFAYRYEYQYDAAGRVVRESEYDNRGELNEDTQYVYNKDSRLVASKKMHGHKARFEDSYLYDQRGLLIEQTSTCYADNGERQFILSYKYTDYKLDSAGNWIERKESEKHADYNEAENVTVQRRQLTYF